MEKRKSDIKSVQFRDGDNGGVVIIGGDDEYCFFDAGEGEESPTWLTPNDYRAIQHRVCMTLDVMDLRQQDSG